MENEFQQDYDVRDCAAVKVSTTMANLHVLIINPVSCAVRRRSMGCLLCVVLRVMGGKKYTHGPALKKPNLYLI